IALRSGQRGGISGTPAFMAPEQWSGLPATPQTDVYAATGVYFQCVMGHEPFPTGTVEQLRDLHLQMWPDLTTLAKAIAHLVRRGMAKDPRARPATAGLFHEELERAATTVYGSDWRRRGILALAGAAGAFAGLLPLALVGADPTTGATVSVTEDLGGAAAPGAPGVAAPQAVTDR